MTDAEMYENKELRTILTQLTFHIGVWRGALEVINHIDCPSEALDELRRLTDSMDITINEKFYNEVSE